MFLIGIGTPMTDKNLLQSRVEEARMSTELQLSQKKFVHRRSSVPFANRSPKVRFLRGAVSHAVSETGPCFPIIGGSSEETKIVKQLKSNLKKNEHPILIDVNLLSKLDIDELSTLMTNDILSNCKIAVDQETQRLYAAERHARGAIDILTFPSSYSIVEPFSRFLGTVLICIETLEIVRQQNENIPEKRIKHIESAILDFVRTMAKCQVSVKLFLSRTEEIFKLWSSAMKIKSEFYIEHSKINVPVYPNKTMPENVTLYEDIRDENERYLYDGVVTLALVKQVVCVWSDLSNDGLGVRQTFSNMTLEQQCEIIITLINHSKDLVIHSSKYITSAMKTLTDNDYINGFEDIRKRLTAITFDDYFDPLCGLDLKNSFGELVERKCELLNIANKMHQNINRTQKLIAKLHQFTMQVIRKQIPSKLSCCPCSKFYTRDKIMSSYRTITEIAINVPMSAHFQTIICTPTSSAVALELGEGDHDQLDIHGSFCDLGILSSQLECLIKTQSNDRFVFTH